MSNPIPQHAPAHANVDLYIISLLSLHATVTSPRVGMGGDRPARVTQMLRPQPEVVQVPARLSEIESHSVVRSHPG